MEQKSVKKRNFIAAAIIVFALVAGGLSACGSPSAIKYENGRLQVTVLDGFTDEPVKGAQVVIPEIDECLMTDEEGRTPEIDVPVIKDAHYETLSPAAYGRITILVYCEGYVPYALFYVHTREGELRRGPTTYLFKPDSAQSIPVISIIEGPDQDWAEKVVEKYRP